MELSERKEKILSAIVERFITTGEPVGSKFLASVLPLTVSPATVRNDMAFLSEKGYLEQPHTSAGRIPSDKGYRYYIEKLLQNFTPSDSEIFRINAAVDHSEGETNILLAQICELLSSLTGCAAVASCPDSEGAIIKSTQIVPVGRYTAMLVVSTSSGALKSRIAKLDKEIEYPLMELFYSIAAANFTGTPAADFTRAKLQSITASLGERAFEIMPLLISLFEAVAQAVSPGLVVRGQSNLLNSRDLHASAVDIIELLRSAEAVSAMLKMSGGSDIELKIGNENEYACMRAAALIKAAYKAGDSGRGVLAVIGPTKMDYSRIIPLIKYVSGVTGTILSEAIDI